MTGHENDPQVCAIFEFARYQRISTAATRADPNSAPLQGSCRPHTPAYERIIIVILLDPLSALQPSSSAFRNRAVLRQATCLMHDLQKSCMPQQMLVIAVTVEYAHTVQPVAVHMHVYMLQLCKKRKVWLGAAIHAASIEPLQIVTGLFMRSGSMTMLSIVGAQICDVKVCCLVSITITSECSINADH